MGGVWQRGYLPLKLLLPKNDLPTSIEASSGNEQPAKINLSLPWATDTKRLESLPFSPMPH